jgi:localization factor PodJL
MPKAPQPDYAEAEFSPARFVPAEETMRRPPENPRVAVLQEHDLLQEAAEADIALDAVETIDAGTKKQQPASKSLIAGLAARLKRAKNEPAAGSGRVSVDPAPALDAGEMLVTEDSSLLLEPGSGVPDIKKIMAKVRAGQKASADASPVGGQADVIAAARRAAQAAAQEAGQQKFVQPAAKDKPAAKVKKPAGAGEIRRPILLAAAAVLLVVMSYPLVSNLIGNRQAEIQAEVAPVAAEPIAQETAAAPVAVEPDRALNAQAIEPADQTTVDGVPAAEPHDIETGAEKLMAPAEDASKTGTLEKSDATEPATENTTTPSGEKPVVTANATDGAADTIQPPAAVTTAGNATLPAGLQPAALADAAKKGDPLAFFEIGARYTDGRGGAKVDLAEAAKWYELAAEKGLAPAEYRLANFYEKGTGVTRDMAKAKALYLSAAEKGNASAMHNLAVLHATGAAGTPDFNEAARWFQKAAELNVRDSQFNLAILYARGNGVAQDLEESYKWFAVAAKQGDRDAAQKRDEVANALSPDKLKSAKAKLDLWKPVELNDKANSAVVPDAWLAKSNTTASIDMKRAIRNIQAILNNNGFDAGKPDGEMGKKTVDAIKAFQISVGQQPSGRIDDALVKELLARNKKA